MKIRPKPRIIYNDDTISLRNIPQPHTPEKVRYAVDYLKDTQVDILCWSMSAVDLAYSWPSKVIENFYSKTPYDKESRDLTHGLFVQGIDYLPLLINRTRAHGLRFFASFRMNDIHHASDPNSPATSEFWKTHQDYRLWEVTNGLTYYNACLDYSYPEVRDRYFNAIVEVTRNYDIDGVEVDFCRSPYVFSPSLAWSKRKTLTDYIKKIRTTLDGIGKEKSKRIGLMIRVPFTREMLAKAGMDVEIWIRQGLMDILVMSNLANDYNMSVEPWLTLCRKHNVLFYPSVEVCPARHHEDAWRLAPTLNRYLRDGQSRSWTDAFVKSTRAAAQNFWCQGVDGIYMFNYPCALFERKNRVIDKDPLLKPLVNVLSEIGSNDTLAHTDKLYYFYTDLPILVQSNRPRQFHQTIKFVIGDPELKNRNTRVSLWFRQEVQNNPHAVGKFVHNGATSQERLKYYLNDWEIPWKHVRTNRQPAGSIWGFRIGEHELVEINLPGDRFVQGENHLAFHIPHFPKAGDPFIYIYELDAEVSAKRSR